MMYNHQTVCVIPMNEKVIDLEKHKENYRLYVEKRRKFREGGIPDIFLSIDHKPWERNRWSYSEGFTGDPDIHITFEKREFMRNLWSIRKYFYVTFNGIQLHIDSKGAKSDLLLPENPQEWIKHHSMVKWAVKLAFNNPHMDLRLLRGSKNL